MFENRGKRELGDRVLTYKPIIKKQDSLDYFEIQPHEHLQKYINCFWVSNEKLNTGEEIIIPDLCCDILMEVEADGTVMSTSFCAVNNRFFIHQGLEANTYLFGVRFYVWSAFLFSDILFYDTLNRRLETNMVFKDFESTIQLLFHKYKKLKRIINELNYYFLSKLENSKRNDISLEIADWIGKLYKESKYTKIEEILGSEEKSLRQIQRMFKDYLGLSPKQTLDTIRFQKIMKDIKENVYDDQTLAYGYGFTDQAHFIKSFKTFSGSTPREMRQYFKK